MTMHVPISNSSNSSSSSSTEACCTCATLLTNVPRYDETRPECEKPLPPERRLECCPRVICGRCLGRNDRFFTYCPYCQISQTPSTLPPGLKAPPSYDSAVAASEKGNLAVAPPPYAPSSTSRLDIQEKGDTSKSRDAQQPAEDILHFLDHANDTMASLALRYSVPIQALRRVNKITSDHLLLGRRTVVIPGEYYKGGVSLSPRPIEGEEEELRKGKIRRWMVACKVHEYDVAVLYLEQANYDLEMAMEAYFADEEWERTHPIDKGKGAAKGPKSLGFRGRRS